MTLFQYGTLWQSAVPRIFIGGLESPVLTLFTRGRLHNVHLPDEQYVHLLIPAKQEEDRFVTAALCRVDMNTALLFSLRHSDGNGPICLSGTHIIRRMDGERIPNQSFYFYFFYGLDQIEWHRSVDIRCSIENNVWSGLSEKLRGGPDWTTFVKSVLRLIILCVLFFFCLQQGGRILKNKRIPSPHK